MAYAASGSAVSGELFGLGAPVVWGGKVKGVRCCFVCGGFWATELGCGVLGCGGGRLWWGFIRLFWWGGGGVGRVALACGTRSGFSGYLGVCGFFWASSLEPRYSVGTREVTWICVI